jgi:hypothetical protein
MPSSRSASPLPLAPRLSRPLAPRLLRLWRLTSLAALSVAACASAACSDGSVDGELEPAWDAALDPEASAEGVGADAGPDTSPDGASPADAGPDAPRDGGDAGDAGAPTPWATFAAGIAARQTGLGGGGARDVVVVYGGFGATSLHVRALADELFARALSSRGTAWLVAVKGPDDAAYLRRADIANSALAAELTRAGYGAVTLLAHSSGAYVAEELLGQLAPTAGALARVRYYVLDGAARDLAPHRASLGTLRFVYAKDGALLSRNAAAMQAAAAAAGLAPFEVRATGSGCVAADCLHDAVIIGRPWSSTTFDVARDYTQFAADRPVVTSYLAP